MKDRHRELMRLLLENHEGFFHVKELADRLSCSDKTIRNDLDFLQPYIKKETNGSLIRRTGFGIQLVIEDDERDWLSRFKVAILSSCLKMKGCLSSHISY
jgi:activator of the mannose operon, transcriptional antiterminator